MEISELKELERIERERHKKEMAKISIEYAKSNQRFTKGQIIDNGRERIKIGNISVDGWCFSTPPCCVYRGIAYTARNTPYKNGRVAAVRESDEIKLIEG